MTQIDNDAKLKVQLFKLQDKWHNDYYVGKLQFPGTFDYGQGMSFMVFVSETGVEELQIGPVDPEKQSKKVFENRQLRSYPAKIHIDLHASLDKNGNKYYLGEISGPGHTVTTDGIFFNIFLSKEGKEEIQIGPLVHNRKKKVQNE